MQNFSSPHFPRGQLPQPISHYSSTRPSQGCGSPLHYQGPNQTQIANQAHSLGSSACLTDQQLINSTKRITPHPFYLPEQQISFLERRFEQECKVEQDVNQATSYDIAKSSQNLLTHNHCPGLSQLFNELFNSSNSQNQVGQVEQDEQISQNQEAYEVESVSSIHSGDSYLSVRHMGLRELDSDFDSTDVSSDDSYLSELSELGGLHDLFQEC